MSLRCSLLGHSYGDAEIEREREEQGNEVIVTVRELETCDRCGKHRTVSENKEVTAISPAQRGAESASGSDAAAASTGAGGSESEGSAAGGATSAGSSAASGAAAGTESTADAGSSATDAGTAASVGDEIDAAQSADEDDGIILDDGPSDGDDDAVDQQADATGDDDAGEDDDSRTELEREPGEWPEDDRTHPGEVESSSEPTAWPEVAGDDEGFDAESGGSGGADVEFGGGLTPESAPEVEDDEDVEFVNAEGDTLDAEAEEKGDTDLSAGFTAGESAPTPSGPSEEPDVDATFVCPECGFEAPASGSSMRAGDICPECRKGYLGQE